MEAIENLQKVVQDRLRLIDEELSRVTDLEAADSFLEERRALAHKLEAIEVCRRNIEEMRRAEDGAEGHAARIRALRDRHGALQRQLETLEAEQRQFVEAAQAERPDLGALVWELPRSVRYQNQKRHIEGEIRELEAALKGAGEEDRSELSLRKSG